MTFNKDEYLVFFEWLSRFNESNGENIFKDQAEERVLWNLEAVLETKISETFSNDYKNILKKAYDNLRDSKK